MRRSARNTFFSKEVIGVFQSALGARVFAQYFTSVVVRKPGIAVMFARRDADVGPFGFGQVKDDRVLDFFTLMKKVEAHVGFEPRGGLQVGLRQARLFG